MTSKNQKWLKKRKKQKKKKKAFLNVKHITIDAIKRREQSVRYSCLSNTEPKKYQNGVSGLRK